jgi:prepilin-type N-terminal cleavage/methylation domain-containing protein
VNLTMPVAVIPVEAALAPRRGLTLVELLLVLTVISILATLVLPAVGNFLGQSRADVTRASLARTRDAIAETYWSDNRCTLPRPGLPLQGNRQNSPQIRYLFVNPQTEDATTTFDPVARLGWRGPYLVDRNDACYAVNAAAGFSPQFGENGDPAVLDGWGRPIVLQNPGLLADGRQDVRLVSAAPDGIQNISPAKATAALTAADVGDDVFVSFEVR